jgi:hypothetical protein
MKKMILLASAAIAFSLTVNAQCPTKVLYTLSKMEMLDSGMHVTDTRDITATLETSATGIFIHKSENEGDTMTGTINKATCDWREPYKNGKVVMICDMHDEHEDLKSATMTIEAVDGKITILLNAVEHPEMRLRLQVAKYEENPKN